MKSITIETVALHAIGLPFVEPLRTSFGEEPFKSAILVELKTTDGVTGWGEVSTEIHPGYGSETMGTAAHVLPQFLLPLVIGQTVASPTDIPALIASVRGHHMTKHGLEAAVWDAWAKTNGIGLAEAFAAHLPEGHTPRGYGNVGVSIGIKPSVEATCEVIQKRLDQGYRRIKLKIEPGWDVELARGVRERFPDITLMLDANSAYTLADADMLKQLDTFNLLMIEQPLAYDDIYEHRKLQPQLKTPICLDESILSADDARMALELGACRIINLKPARVGGYSESLEIYKVCVEHDAPLWIGGMMETGIGRASNLAFASLPGVTLPCDISATDRYFNPDITEPPFVIRPDSTIPVAAGAGIGVEVVAERVHAGEHLWHVQYPYQAS